MKRHYFCSDSTPTHSTLWDLGDVNPPVHAWSAIFTHRLEQILERGKVAGVVEIESGPGGQAGDAASRRGR